jgi:protein involved in polysaccharide export with SLBB domain
MYLKYIYFFIICFVLASLGLSAQTVPLDPQKKVSEYSDQQIQLAWEKMQSSGYSEAEVYSYLAEKGMPSTEIEALKRRIEVAKAGGGSMNTGKNISRIDTTNYSRTPITPITPPPIEKKNRIFGYDYFTNPNLRPDANINVATPSNYILGPGDVLIINLTGANERPITSKISPDGNILVSSVGLIYLNGLTIEQARAQIRSRLSRAYPLLNTGQTKVTVSLGNNRRIQITVTGEAVKPGQYYISSLTTLFNALYLTGGPSPIGSLRNIELIRNGKVLRTIDFYPFLTKSLFPDDIRLEDQDIIHFPIYKKRVAIDGEIKRPGLYELQETETLQDLIQYAGGFSDKAYKLTAKIIQVGEIEKNFRNISSELFDAYKPKNADSIYFEPISERYSNRIVLRGAVNRPGPYELPSAGLTLKQLILEADGLREDAFLSRVLINRTNPNLNKEQRSYDLANGIPDIPLMREDTVIVFSNRDLKDESSIVVGGFVRSPSRFTFREGMKLSDVIAMAGGFAIEAATQDIRINRINKNRSDTVANQLTTTITVNADNNTAANTFLLEPQDYIYVPRLVNYRSLGNVTIRGEVLFPGDYPLERRDESALELIQKASGLTPSGSLANTQIHRNGRRVEMDLTGKKTGLSAKELILMPGDSIIVPRENPFVEVSGAVNSPQLIKYAGMNFKYYINSAGGAKENARIQGSYIQYANGTNKAVKKFLFFRNYPSVEPGSIIIVPKKALGPPHISLAEIGGITSAITALISLIAILRN